MKTSLHLNLSQQLTLTPQLQQAIRLLQLSTIDLQQEILQAAESNPLLEIEDNPQGDYIGSSRRSQAGSSNEDSYQFENTHCSTTNLNDHLHWQLNLSPFTDTDRIIGTALIDAIDDDGFLETSLEDIQSSIANSDYQFDIDEIEAVLHRIQRFDPVGCGARDLAECLHVQLGQLEAETPYLDYAKDIVTTSLELLATRHYPQLLRKFKIKEEVLQAILHLIQSLNPKPGSKISTSKTEYITPDVILSKENDQWVVRLNQEALPKIAINPTYSSLGQYRNNTDSTFIKNHLQEARWFIKSIQNRQETLLKVAKSIVHFQAEFFEHGEEAMKPLVLHDIAEYIDMHESTISRVTTQKYIHTPRGIFELKYFFSSHVNTSQGGECSSTAIRAVIKKLVAAENRAKPLSDNKIAQLLADKGIKVARRTIAKYRESMGIAPSHERKSIITD